METTAAGPFDNWPTGIGFEYFYGFLAGEASQYEPNLVRNTTSVLPPETPEEGYHLSEDLADDAIGWLHRHKAFEPDKPFFMYWASGCLHGPHHVMKEWADKYAGKFDDGWDAYRERVFARAKEKGWIPADAQLTPRDPQMPAWDDIPEEQRPFQRRLMEVAAGFAEHVDVQVGRLLDEIERLGYGDNTLVFYIWGDNGSSGEGQNGTISELLAQNGIPTTVDMHIKALEEMGGLDVLGTPKVDNQYHAGWAWAGSTPYKGMKLLASAPRRDPQPDGRPLAGEDHARRDAAHASSITATTSSRRSTRCSGITPPRVVNGVPQDPIDGVSFAYAFDDPTPPGRLLHPVLRDHGQPRDLPRRLDGLGDRPAAAVGPRPAAGHRRNGRPTTTVGALQPRRGLVAGQRPRRGDARQARADEGDVRHRGGAQQRLPDRRRPLDLVYAPRAAHRHRPTANGTSPATSPGCPSSALPPSATAPTSSRSTPTFPTTPAACSTRWAAPAAGSPATSTTATSATSTTCSSSMRTKIRVHADDCPPGRAKIEIETDVRRAATRRPAEHHPDRRRRRQWPPARARSAPRCCSPPTTASTSAPASADPSPSTTTTGHRSRSTARSTPSTSATRRSLQTPVQGLAI